MMPAKALLPMVLAVLAGGSLMVQAGPARSQDRSADGLIWRAEDLLGRTIHNPKGENLGAIDDLLINSEHKVIHALVDVGGVLGIGDEQVAIALGELTVTPDGTLILDSTPAELAGRPQYRFPESPTTGAIRPGPQRPQAVARAAEATSAQDGPLAEILGGREAPSFDGRDQFLRTATRSLDAFGQRLSEQQPAADRQVLTEKYDTAVQRLESLKAASAQAWPTVLQNFRQSVAQLQDDWQQSAAVPPDGVR